MHALVVHRRRFTSEAFEGGFTAVQNSDQAPAWTMPGLQRMALDRRMARPRNQALLDDGDEDERPKGPLSGP